MASVIEQPTATTQRRPHSRRRWWLPAVAALLLAGIGWPAWRHLQSQQSLMTAHELLRQAQPEQAIVGLQRLIDRTGESGEAVFLLAAAKRRAGRLAEVEPLLARAEQLGWDPRAIHRQRFLAIFQAGDCRRAGPYVKQLLADGGSDDDAEEVYEAMVRGYFAALLVREARFMIESWRQWRPTSPRPYRFEAEAASQAGDLQAEIAAYRGYLAVDPTNYETRILLAEALLNYHEYDEALSVLGECGSERPGDAPVLIGLGECLLRKGELAAAQEKLDAARRLPLVDSQRVTVLLLLAKLAIAQADHEGALELLGEAVKISPSNMPALYALGQSLERVGRKAEAKKHLDRWHFLKRISDRALELQEELVRNPDSADWRCEMGTLLLQKDPLDLNGVNWLLRAVQCDSGHVASHRALANYYKAAGDLEAAARHWAAAEQLQPADQAPSDEQQPAEATNERGIANATNG
jgi:tetratricopeptide (TPR) repeat protein